MTKQDTIERRQNYLILPERHATHYLDPFEGCQAILVDGFDQDTQASADAGAWVEDLIDEITSHDEVEALRADPEGRIYGHRVEISTLKSRLIEEAHEIAERFVEEESNRRLGVGAGYHREVMTLEVMRAIERGAESMSDVSSWSWSKTTGRLVYITKAELLILLAFDVAERCAEIAMSESIED